MTDCELDEKIYGLLNEKDDSLGENASWLNKYTPKNFDDCLLKGEEKTLMDSWLKLLIENESVSNTPDPPKGKGKGKGSKKKNQFDTNCLFLYGPPGIGKTTIAKLLFKKYNFDTLEFNASDTRTAKTIQDKLNQVGGSHNVIDFMCNRKRKISIILDEIDGLSNGDKGGMTEINNIIAESRDKNTPFICISNNVCKKTDSLKRKSLFIKVSKPTDASLKKIVSLINKEEGLKLETNIINLVIKKAQGDIRRCITLLEYIYRNKKKLTSIENNITNNIINNSANNITMSIAPSQNVNEDEKGDTLINDDICGESTENIIENYSRKLTELAPYEMCEKVLNSMGTLEFFLQNFNFDHSMTNWYIYENFVKYIDKNRIGSFNNKLVAINEVYDCFAESDLIERDVIIRQNYEFYDYINLIKTHGASFWANHGFKKTSYNKMGMMNYSTLLNRTSLEYSNSKNWMNVNNLLKCNQNTNITSDLCNIFFKNVELDNHEFIKWFLEEYNVHIDDIDKIIKMSSFYNKSQPQVLTNFKKKIKMYYNNS
jgi:DNA polymerase III delta prime subunit